MPRKKTVQPPPLEEFVIYHGIMPIQVEIRDETCREVFRGSHMRDKYTDKLYEVADIVAKDYLTPEGPKNVAPEDDYMSTPTRFTDEMMEGWNFGNSHGNDDSAYRKKLYRDVKKEITVLTNAIARKKRDG